MEKTQEMKNGVLHEKSNITDNQTTMDYNLNDKLKTINILLLGETGVGKSTWINGFVNYLTYNSLDEAEKGDPVSLITSKFTVTDSSFKQHMITYGSEGDTNGEAQKTGQSATQTTKTYSFQLQNVTVKIIDTPGIGDTRGIEKDKENMQNIMDHLSHYDELHGIVILLKPNNSRLNVMFSFCIKELLTHLHKDACKNILICFTNARSTFYRPGDTMPSLQELLSSQAIDIKFTRETVYCMDNESVRFLMALKTITFHEEERQDYATSWKKSVDESRRLICYISHLPPHLIQMTLSINEVRRSIIEQSRPMALIAQAIQTHINAIEDQQRVVISENSTKEELHKKLKVPIVTLKTINLDYPRTICTSPSCISVLTNSKDGTQQIHYKTICHPRCYVSTQQNVIRCVELQKCWAMDTSNGTCRKCSCSWETHMHITYDMAQETVWVEDENIKDLINGKEESIIAIKEHQKILNDKLKQLNGEKNELAKVNAVFACFLKHNAIAAYNDALLDYLDHLIESEKMKIGVGSSSETYGGLIKLKRVYQEEITAIDEALKTKTKECTSLDVGKIHDLIIQLKMLPNVGKMLHDVMTEVRKANDKTTKFNEKVIFLPSKSLEYKPVQNRKADGKEINTVVPKLDENTTLSKKGFFPRMFGKVRTFILI